MTLIPGIRSFAIDLFCLHRKFLVFNLVQRNLKLKYRQSLLGMLWTVLVPAASAFVYYLVFLHVMKVNIPHYLLFVVGGTLPWAFFATALLSGMESIVGNYALVNKVPLPLQVFPLSEALTGFINLLFAVPVIVVILIFSGPPVTLALTSIPLFFGLLFFQGYGLALVLSVAFVYMRDLRHALGVLLQMWFYMTPILYTTEMLPPLAKQLMWLNPVAYIFEGIHLALVFGQTIDPTKWAISVAWTVTVFFIGTSTIKKCRGSLAEGI